MTRRYPAIAGITASCLARNPYEVESDAIKDITVLETIVGGKSVYRTPAK